MLNVPKLKQEGQGLSKKQLLDLKASEKAALAWTSANGRRYEDPDFPCSPNSLGTELSQHVTSWRRPSEFAENPLLFKNFWEIEGVQPSPLLNDRWFLGALNIVAGNKDNVDRMFLSALKEEGAKDQMAALSEQGAREGFYIVRFYHDDPASDDDWVCVLVDDRIPCGKDGKPCFARCPDEHVFWVMLVEKAYAKYVGGYHLIGHKEVEFGLELLCGGVADEPVEMWVGMPGKELIPGGSSPETLWSMLLEKISTNHAIGGEYASRPEPGASTFPKMPMFGISADQPYCVLIADEVRQAGKMIRMRTFRGDAEWSGKWSDGSEYWTNNLRKLLSYSADADDGSFWMEYADFAKYFNRVWMVRMADDQWTRWSVRSEWRDMTAGGSVSYVSWVHNYQWRLRVKPGSKPARVFITVTVPDAPTVITLAEEGEEGKPSPVALTYSNAIGLDIFKGYAGNDKKRQRMEVKAQSDLVHRLEPQFRRKIVTEVLLQPADEPYLLRPFLSDPGRESAFTLVVLSDDKDDDGVPDFEFNFIDEVDNWKRTWLSDAWEADSAGGPLSSPQWDTGPQYQLLIKEPGTRVFLLLELIDADRDGRDQAGIQSIFDAFPQVAIAVLEGKGKNVRIGGPDAPRPFYGSKSRDPYPDGLILELPADALPPSPNPYLILPFTCDPGVRHKFAIAAYASKEVEFSKVNPEPCDLCVGDCKTCPMVQIMRRLDALETRFDNHLSFLEQL
mmetsp:Transcript_5363/g.13308  ORF Transcript_5363/g.13308 Transcript_5363/m.13308 type:complete len:731 (-) Transcript_5363:186-2378(-)